MKTEIEAHGKINLALDVLYKRDDGYHEIKSVMQQISLSDTLIIEDDTKGVKIECDSPYVPSDGTNLVYKAWKEISKIAGTNAGIRVRIIKRIPVAAGLAGGSADGAAVIAALNDMWELGMTKIEMMEIGLKIGADLPFCLLGGTALAEGVGEKLTELKTLSGVHVLLAAPGIQISTADTYSKLRLRDQRLPVDEMVLAIERGEIKGVTENLSNVLEEVIFPENPKIAELKNLMTKFGAMGSLMSGSGSSVFGIFEDEDKLNFAYTKFRKLQINVIKTATV
ncbi:MAG: 4-(cytidine 5'-diphospho)-2-C-methyl-D-erythritol kinase [Gudongella sp.]|nr:4-(cytidine 5'-diphospho)-2-C-methyl-D-erythritol kinase [Gudongella sp.]